MIKSFADKATRLVYQRQFVKKFPFDVHKTGLRKLRMINNAQNFQDLKNPPGNRLEKLKGKREGQYSIRINDQWRICFIWQDNDAYEVEITDYH